MSDDFGTINPDAIAVIGMAGRFPGATDIARFWRNLSDGVESVTFWSREELLDRGVVASLLDDPLYVRASAVLDGVEMFDAEFFGFTPREAEITDPQHRVFLECAWEALEDSGYDPEAYDGQIGVYAGAGLSTYLLNYVLRRPDVVRSAGALPLQLGNNKDYVPLRVSYKLHLRGPSVNVNTACSSSLVAVHLACQSLLDHQCDIALAGGVGIQVPQDRGYAYAPNGILSPDGHCRAFDARAEGTVSGNGAGLVILKRYAEAVADGDAIRAVILGSAVNNDGAAKVGFTAPSMEGQARVIGETLAVADVDPDTLGYVEAHGTGTPLGDPIEVAALTSVFRSYTARTGFCALGSVKTNVGHLDEAAGVAGLVKTVLALQHAAIPPSLHFERPNPEIDFERSPFYLPTRLSPWAANGAPRRAGVSSFGIGGTNAHVVLQEAPLPEPAAPSRPWQLLLLSARTETALDALTARLAAHFRGTPGIDLADAAYTLFVGRKDFPHRRMVLCRDIDGAVNAIESRRPERVVTGLAPSTARPVAFLFPGQGSQHVDMGLGLYRTEPVFRETLDRAAERLRPELGFDLRTVLYPPEARAEEEAARLEQTAVAQPALFTVEYALARLLMSWGIRPEAMIGHSIGEYIAAVLAGVFSFEDGLCLVAARGRLMQEMPAGAMLAVKLSEDELGPYLREGLELALANAPSLSVVSGAIAAVDALQRELSARGIACRRLHTSHAFHSASMEPILEAFRRRVRAVSLGAPEIPFLSNLTGRWITAGEATDPEYWARHLRHTVRFSDGVRQLLRQPGQVFLEVGPGRTLGTLIGRHPEGTAVHPVLGALRHPHDPRDDAACLLEAVGRLWLAGACRKPAGFYAAEKRRRVPLPTYPFERRRFWLDPPAESAAEEVAAPVFAAVDEVVGDWFYLPAWNPRRTVSLPGRDETDGASWLLFLDAEGVGGRLAERLRGQGRSVATVVPGAAFECLGDGAYALNSRRSGDYDALLGGLAAAGLTPCRIVHLWSVAPPVAVPWERWEGAQRLGFYSLLFLAQALGRRGLVENLCIDVVSSHMQQVTGGELSCPEKATLLGLVRVAPKEYPGIRWRSIDLALARESSQDLLLAEILSHDPAPVIAIRGDAVWEQAFEARHLPAADPAPARLRQGGTYLISGGLGSMGSVLARYLAKEVRARLVLIGRTGLPPETEWDGWLRGTGSEPETAGAAVPPSVVDFDPAAETELVESLESRAKVEAALTDVDGDERLQALLHAYCSRLIGRYFAECGVELAKGHTYGRDELRRRLRVLPRFERFLVFLLRALAEDDIVRIGVDGIEVLGDEGRENPAAVREMILAEYPEFQGLAALLEHCTASYAPALSGGIPSISVLYPDGTPALLDQSGRDTPAYAGDGVYLETAARLVAHIADQPAGEKLRILEVGGGSGGLTRSIVQALGNRAVDYLFTDLGQSFVRRAEREAAANGIDFMRFGLFDITRDPEAQGYARHGFDLVLGYNVVHATPEIGETVGHLRSLLAPRGLLVLVETTRLRRWDEMVWGLTEGWWHYTDDSLRGDSPLLGLGAWEELLRGRGFDAVAAYPREERARRTADTGLIVARQPRAPAETDVPPDAAESAHIRAAIAAVRDIRRLGGEVLAIPADLADESRMRAALAEARERFGEIHGVIHTAGVLGQGLIHTKTPDEARKVFAGKAVGLLLLDNLLAEQGTEPDFLILCASLASVSPIAGQVDYCAANAFLDAYAAYRSGFGRTAAISIDWGFWQELGMIRQAKMPEAWKQGIVEEIREHGRSGAGLEAFRRILAHCPPPQVLVAPDRPQDFPLLQVPATARAADAPARQRPVHHPWFDECLVETPELEAYVSRLTIRHWVLNEHRPLGRAVLPGTAYLELARAAMETHGPGRPLQLSEVYFLAPLVVEDHETKEVRTLLKKRDAGFEFVVVSRVEAGADEWLEHARGEIVFLAREPPSALDPDGLAQRCGEEDIVICEGDSPDEAHPFVRRVRNFTPHWRNFQRLRLGSGEALATLRLPAEFTGEPADLLLHPALLDMATGFMSMVDGFESGVPFCYRRVCLWRPLASGLHSHARRVENRQPDERSYDATILDDAGNVLLEVAGFTLKAFAEAGDTPALPEEQRNFCVEIERPGSLATLGLRPDRRRNPAPGEVEIEVAAAGLNFIEVLYALGLLPEPPGGGVRFGLECAGAITAVGEGVAGFRPGDEVYGLAPRAFSRYTTTDAAAIAHKPDHLTLTEAATVPAAYATAYYSLMTRARLRRGERLLIHAASGGVGLAAVNIAEWRGAEIFATAGTPAKRKYLQSLGIRHVFDSRSLDFAGQVLTATEGRGVDVVLNSLGGEFIAASLSVLARYGRFLELGKRDIFRNTVLGLAPFEKHLAFFAIDVGTDLPEFGSVWRQLTQAVRRRDFPPLPYREFSVGRVAEAFEYMAQGKHIGKLVVAVGGADGVSVSARRRRGRPLADIVGRGRTEPGHQATAEAKSPEATRGAARRDPGHARPALSTAYRAPTGETESKVVDIWRELLGVPGIGVDDNFFELRGDSLLAAQVTSRLYEAFRMKLPLSSVFEYPTAAGLAARIEQSREFLRELETAPAALPREREVEHEL